MVQRRSTLKELREIDARLAGMARCEGALLLCLGEALAAFEERRWHEYFGCSLIGDYVRQAAQRSARWGKELILLAQRVRRLPKLRAAIIRGEVAPCVAHRLARVAEPEDEEMWIEAGRGLSVRALDALLTVEPEPGEEGHVEAGDEERLRPIERSVSMMEQMMFLAACLRLDRVGGERLRGTDLVMAVCAEAENALIHHAKRFAADHGFDEAKHRRALEARRRNRAQRLEAEARVDEHLPRRAPLADVPSWEIPDDLRGLDQLIRDLAAHLANVDLEVGRSPRTSTATAAGTASATPAASSTPRSGSGSASGPSASAAA